MKRILSLMLVLMLVLVLFVGCSESGSSGGGAATVESVAGLYKVKSMNGKPIKEALSEELAGNGMNIDDYLDMVKEHYQIESIEDMMTMTLKADGTCSMAEMGEEMKGTWTLDGNKVSVTIDGDTLEATYSNGTISFSDTGSSDVQSMVFAKAG